MSRWYHRSFRYHDDRQWYHHHRHHRFCHWYRPHGLGSERSTRVHAWQSTAGSQALVLSLLGVRALSRRQARGSKAGAALSAVLRASSTRLTCPWRCAAMVFWCFARPSEAWWSTAKHPPCEQWSSRLPGALDQTRTKGRAAGDARRLRQAA